MGEINIIELYGACTILKTMIDATQKTIDDNNSKGLGTVPGQEYLNNRLRELFKDINIEIFNHFSGTINTLQKAIEESDNDS